MKRMVSEVLSNVASRLTRVENEYWYNSPTKSIEDVRSKRLRRKKKQDDH